MSAETALEEFKKQKKELEEMNLKLIEANNKIELQRHEIVALKVSLFCFFFFFIVNLVTLVPFIFDEI